MMRILLFGALAVLAWPEARGALGDSEPQSLEKYGPSVKETSGSGVGEKLLYYEKGGVGIGAEYWKGKAGCMFYKRTVRGEALSNEEIEEFLKENAGGSFWEGAHVIGEGKRWARKDGAAVAHYIAAQGLLVVMTDTFALERMRKKGGGGP